MNPSDPARPSSADTVPLPASQRYLLLAKLVLIPFALVCIPAVLVFHWSDRDWTFASHKKAGEPDVSALRGSLERTAQKGLPAPEALDPGPVQLLSLPERLAARVDKIGRVAQDLGGSATEGLPEQGVKHLFIELPAGQKAAFLAAIRGGAPVPASPRPAANGSPGEQFEVIIRTGDE